MLPAAHCGLCDQPKSQSLRKLPLALVADSLEPVALTIPERWKGWLPPKRREALERLRQHEAAGDSTAEDGAAGAGEDPSPAPG